MNAALATLDDWPAAHAAAAVVAVDGTVAEHGPVERPFPLASVTKLLTTMAVLVAVEEGTVALDDPAGPADATVAHLLAHASGLGPDGTVLAAPGTRRIYSNAGFELLAAHLATAARMPFATYALEAIIAPVGLSATSVDGSPASGAVSTVSDLARLAAELLAPSVLAGSTLAAATSVAFPGLDGVLPGFGRQSPNDWGLGFEIRGHKAPHWTGEHNDPTTFGHFGQSGTFLWVDPVAVRALVCLTDHAFGPWAAEAWPALSDQVLDA